MNCPQCGQENPSQAKFCFQCATPFALRCANCGTQLLPAAKFCFECATPVVDAKPPRQFVSPDSYIPKHLAERIINSKAALEGERKQVTVLFADLKGSMELLADRDPEEARNILDPVLARMMEAVHHYEGTVNQVMGDGIMALFGAPLAHEDHAVRACYAALRMQDSVKRYAEEARRSHGVNVQIRVGLNSGEVVVRAIDNDLHMDYTAVGQSTHLAARMEQLASAGSILLTPSTLDLVEGLVEVKRLGPVPIKGLADPVEIYEATGVGPARTRLQATVRRGLTRFVGRQAELEQLRRAQELAGNGHGQVAAIVGEAGVGKSRLVYEFTHSHRMQGWLVLEAASVSYGKATSYLPVINLLKSYFKVQDRDDLRDIREKVTGKLLTLDRMLEPTLPALLSLLDVPVNDLRWQSLAPAQRQDETLDAVKRLLLRESREQPLLVIFEDLHWLDSETQALLDRLVETLGAARLLLLVNYRPEYQHTWSAKTYYGQSRLDALQVESVEEFLTALLGDDPGLLPLKQMLVKRGNPFFLEETARTLVETKTLVGERGRYRLNQPIQAIHVPATVQTVIASRIDRLSPNDKHLLQTASVVGKEVAFTLLQAIAGFADEALHCGLERLQAAEFLYETGLFPDREYSFKHALTHDVTYNALLLGRRRELHAQIVATIETLHRDRLAEQTERLAYHAVRGELGEKAHHYLHQAGVKAAGRSALPDARAWFEQALGVLERLPESQAVLQKAFDTRLELRVVLYQAGEVRPALERLRQAQRLADRLDDDARRGIAWAFVGNAESMVGNLDEALVATSHAIAVATRLDNLNLLLSCRFHLGLIYYYRADYERVIELATENLAKIPTDGVLGRFGGSAPLSVQNRFILLMSLAQLGRFPEAAEHTSEVIRLAELTQHPYTIGMAYFGAGMVPLLKGEWAESGALFDHGISVSTAVNAILLLPPVIAMSAWILAQLGRTGDALRRCGEAQRLLDRHAALGLFRPAGYHALARTYLLLNQVDEARRLAVLVTESPAYAGFTAHAQHLLGDIASRPDRFHSDSAESHYRRALGLAEPRGMRPLVAHCHAGLAKLYRRMEKRGQADEHFAIATTMYREMEMTYWLAKLEAELSDG